MSLDCDNPLWGCGSLYSSGLGRVVKLTTQVNTSDARVVGFFSPPLRRTTELYRVRWKCTAVGALEAGGKQGMWSLGVGVR